jgi:hypothetical protein
MPKGYQVNIPELPLGLIIILKAFKNLFFDCFNGNQNYFCLSVKDILEHTWDMGLCSSCSVITHLRQLSQFYNF